MEKMSEKSKFRSRLRIIPHWMSGIMLAQWSMTLQINGLLADFLYAPYTTDAARSGSIAFAGLWNIAMMFLGFFLSVCLFRKIDTMNLGRTADLSLKWGLSVFYFVMQVAAIVIR